MKKILLLALAAFAFAACNKDEKESAGDPTLYSVEVTGGDVVDGAEFVGNRFVARAGTVISITPDEPDNQHIVSPDNKPGEGGAMGWLVRDGGPLKIRNNKFIMPSRNVSLEAKFVENTYLVNTSGCTYKAYIREETEGGETLTQIEGDGVPMGAVVKVIANTPADGYRFDRWEYSPADLDFGPSEYVGDEAGTQVFTMPNKDVEVEVIFVEKGLTITLENCTARAFVGDDWVDYNETVWLIVGTPIELTPMEAPEGQVFGGWEGVTEETGTNVPVAVDYTFEMVGENVTMTAILKDKTVFSPPYILYWDGTNLALGHYGDGQAQNSTLLYTKFGSLVAFTIKDSGDTWNDGSVVFNPTTIPTADMGAGKYGAVPRMPLDTADPGAVMEDYISPRHTDEYLANGAGDICRLAGLSPAEAGYRALNGTLDDYNSGFRLATATEAEAEYSTSTAHKTTLNNTNGWALNAGEEIDSFLPCRGQRYSGSNGAPLQVGTNSGYWTTTTRWRDLYSDVLTCYLFIQNEGLTSDTVNVAAGNGFNNGYAVRCVPDIE